MGANLTQKGFNEVIKSISKGKTSKKEKKEVEEPSQDEIDANWRKVASILGA